MPPNGHRKNLTADLSKERQATYSATIEHASLGVLSFLLLSSLFFINIYVIMYTQKFTRTKYEFNTLAPYTVDSLPLEGGKGRMLSGVFAYLCYYGSVHCVSC